MLELRGLTRRYGDLVALDDLSFTVAEGQLFGFVGPKRRRQDHRHGVLGSGGSIDQPTDMATLLPVVHDHGRVDLDAATLNRRRDAFLRAALD